MIQLNRYHALMSQLQNEINEQLNPGQWTLKDGVWIDSGEFNDEAEWKDAPELGKKIDRVIVSATESHMIKKVKDKPGIVLAAKMPDADSEIRHSFHSFRLIIVIFIAIIISLFRIDQTIVFIT